MGEAKLIHFPDDEALARAAAREWVSSANSAAQEGRKYLVALSGGRITKKLFAQVVELAASQAGSLSNVEFFWADERCLPPDDPESNYRLANELLFLPLGIHSGRVHRIRGEFPPENGAKQATEELLRVAGADSTVPVLDLVLLGMGEDGHIASLFPGDTATQNDVDSIFLSVNNSPKPPSDRVSLGHGPIAAAKEVWVLATGAAKQAALQESLSPTGKTPLASVIQKRPITRIFSDIPLG